MDIRQAIGFVTGKAAKHPYPEHMQDAKMRGIYCH